MASRYLLDTNICIYIRRRRPPEVLERFRALEIGEAGISIITYGELVYGAEKGDATEVALGKLDELTSLLAILPMPRQAGRAYGSVRAALEARGEIIGNNDLWIAAHAMAEDLTLVTNNEREFRRIDGLTVENWVRPQPEPNHDGRTPPWPRAT